MRGSRILVAVLALMLLSACTTTAVEDKKSTASPTSAASPGTTMPGGDPDATSSPSTLTILSSGDLLLHLSVNYAARAGDTYDYTPLFAEIQPWIEGARLGSLRNGSPDRPSR